MRRSFSDLLRPGCFADEKCVGAEIRERVTDKDHRTEISEPAKILHAELSCKDGGKKHRQALCG